MENTEHSNPLHQPKLRTNAGQIFGIVGFVLGLLALLLSFVPCVGMLALIPGVLAIIFSFVGLAQAKKGNGNTGLIIAAIIVSIVGTLIAAFQVFILSKAANHTEDKMEDEWKNMETDTTWKDTTYNDALNKFENMMDSTNESADTSK